MKKIIILIVFLIGIVSYISSDAWMSRPIHHGSVTLNSTTFTKIVGKSRHRRGCIFWNTHAMQGAVLNLCPLNKGVPMTGLFIPGREDLVLPERLNYKGEIIGMSMIDNIVLTFICF